MAFHVSTRNPVISAQVSEVRDLNKMRVEG